MKSKKQPTNQIFPAFPPDGEALLTPTTGGETPGSTTARKEL